MQIPKTLVTTGTFGAIIVTLGAYSVSTNVLDYGGAGFGYCLFLLDFILIFLIFKIITTGVAKRGIPKSATKLLLFLVPVKFLGLLAALYWGLVIYKFSVGYLFTGMLASVLLIGLWVSMSYFAGENGFD